MIDEGCYFFLVAFHNAKATKFHDNMGLKGFLKLMKKQIDPSDQLVMQIQSEMKRIREDPLRRHGFMKYELDLMDARREGRLEGKEEGAIEALVRLGFETEQIATKLTKMYNISHDEALKLIQKVK